jgi:hypothetical protein
MKEPAQVLRIEPRWPVALAILAVLFLHPVLSGRVQFFPIWSPYVVTMVVLVPMAAVRLTAGNARWRFLERTVTLLYFVFATGSTVSNLAYLIGAMVNRTAEIGGIQLLTSSIAVWVTNVLMFSLLYWQIDRGGPEARANKAVTKPDWLFPQQGAPPDDVPPGWRPTFVDYMFLALSTATAFSATDALPLTSRAKILMMLESTISLVTIVVVAARAINILGS